ncbi:MAG: hypothetical protein WED07_16395 [Candidatus Freyarchaeum deiterrae]
MSRGALLAGADGGIIGAITAVIGVIWVSIFSTFSTEISNYVVFLGLYISGVFGTLKFGGVTVSSPYPIPYFPSWSLFGVYSLILTVFFIVTSVLIGFGFYGVYKIGGGAVNTVGIISGIIGISAGAILILVVNLTTEYEQTLLEVNSGGFAYVIPFLPVPIPNFPLMVIGFLLLGYAFILFGSVSISVREMVEKPSAFLAAGILSITAAVFFFLGSSIGSFSVTSFGISLNSTAANIISTGIYFGAIIGFWPMLVAFILWAWVFYSSRNL